VFYVWNFRFFRLFRGQEEIPCLLQMGFPDAATHRAFTEGSEENEALYLGSGMKTFVDFVSFCYSRVLPPLFTDH